MAGVQQRLKLKQTPIDTWSVKEHLTLASAVLRTGDQNWVSVSRTMKQFGEPGRPADWFSQKNCALQYNLILEKADLPRRKRGERQQGGGQEGGQEGPAIVRQQLAQTRLSQLHQLLATQRQEILRLEEQTQLLNSDTITEEEMDRILAEVEAEEAEEERKEVEHRAWLSQREEKKQAIQAALKTGSYRRNTQASISLSEASGSEIDSAVDSPAPADTMDLDVTVNAEDQQPRSTAVAVFQTGGGGTEPSAAVSGGGGSGSPLLTSLLQSPSKSADSWSSLAAVAKVVATSPVKTAPSPLLAAAAPPTGSGSSSSQLTKSEPAADSQIKAAEDEEEEAIVVDSAEDSMRTIKEDVVRTVEDKEGGEVKEEEEEDRGDEEGINDAEEITGEDEEVEAETGATAAAAEASSPQPESDSQPVLESTAAAAEPPPAAEATVGAEEEKSATAAATEAAAEPPQQEALEEAVKEAAAGEAAEIKQETQLEPMEVVVKSEAAPGDGESASAGESQMAEVDNADQPTVKAEPEEDDDEATASAAVATFVPEPDKLEVKTPRRGRPRLKRPKEEPEEAAEPSSRASSPASVKRTASPSPEVSASPVASMRSVSRESESEGSRGISGRRPARNRGERLSQREDQADYSGPGSPGGSVGEDEREYRAWKKSIIMVLAQIGQHKHASLFAAPVSEAEAPEYRQVVLQPLDLATIKKSIECGAIRTTEEFQRDLNLMFFNAIMYNSSDHAVYGLTQAMWRDTERIIREYRNTQALLRANEREQANKAQQLLLQRGGGSVGGGGGSLLSTAAAAAADSPVSSRARTVSGSLTTPDSRKPEEKRKRGSESVETVYPMAKKRRLRNADD